MGSKSKKVTTGYWYYLAKHMGLCRGPVDAIIEMKAGDRTGWTGNVTTSSRFEINAPDLFGGPKIEGGVQGQCIVMMGEDTQTAPPELAALHGTEQPGYRGNCTVYYDGKIGANNPYPKKWAWRVRRVLKGWQGGSAWYPEKAAIWLNGGKIMAMNPAHIVWECLTNKAWGRGIDPSRLDAAAFAECADTLYEEGFGLCIKWTRREDINVFIRSVIDHCGGAIYTDRGTGLTKMKLIRGDYVHDLLPVYDTDSGLLEINECSVATSSNNVNQLIVTYRDPITNLDQTVQVHSLAGIQASGGILNSQTKEYRGLPTADLALRVAQRDLQSLAYPLRRFEMTFDRRAWRINPGDVFRVKNPARGLGDLVLRAGRVEDGTLTDGKIRVTAVLDIYSFPLTSFAGVQPPGYVPPNRQPDLKRHRVIEIPYTTLNRYIPPADFAYIGDDDGYLGTLVEKPTPLSTYHEIAVKDGPAEEDELPPEE